MTEYIGEPAGGPGVTYVLIHLDDVEVGEGTLVAYPSEWSDSEYAELAGVVAAAVHRVAGRCGRRIVIVDPITIEDDYHAPLGAADWLGWEMLPAERHEMAQATRLIPNGSKVIVAGYARHDCVARFVAALNRRGCTVTVHDVATAPLTQRALGAAWEQRGR